MIFKCSSGSKMISPFEATSSITYSSDFHIFHPILLPSSTHFQFNRSLFFKKVSHSFVFILKFALCPQDIFHTVAHSINNQGHWKIANMGQKLYFWKYIYSKNFVINVDSWIILNILSLLLLLLYFIVYPYGIF